MYAIIRAGGQQHKVTEGATLTVKRLAAEAGSTIELTEVLLVGGPDGVKVGAPLVAGAKVVAEVAAHGKGAKRDMFKYTRRVRSRVQRGFRPSETTLLIKTISA
ncbi:MAG: 50S ribosomal protein L21 [Deltaproteobacteria bacterium]|jgi:large subunit ribosomal protein L21|nr:50S ribosomal protein L21 [Deltaproteobacteria bacterium]